MESLKFLQPTSPNEFLAEIPSQTPLSEATLDGQSLENKILNSNKYSKVLHNIYKEEICNANIDQDHKLLIISVHAVFLESGFVCLDPVAEKKIDGFQLPACWGSNSIVNFKYTVPHLLVRADAEAVETVGLKFQRMGTFVYVHGFLSRNTPVGFIRLDASRFITSITATCTSNYDSTGVTKDADGSSKSLHEREMFELWKIAKNSLALPLLTDLCIKTGLEPPPCLTSLFTDLKLKILEFLPGVDMCRVGCVASELRYLSSNNDLWKQKCMEEFALSNSEETSEGDWKEKYLTSREKEKRKKRSRQIRTCGGAILRLAHPRRGGEHRDQQPQISRTSQVITGITRSRCF